MATRSAPENNAGAVPNVELPLEDGVDLNVECDGAKGEESIRETDGAIGVSFPVLKRPHGIPNANAKHLAFGVADYFINAIPYAAICGTRMEHVALPHAA